MLKKLKKNSAELQNEQPIIVSMVRGGLLRYSTDYSIH